MSEFVECQNCGRTFFAENIDCPYCKGQETSDDESSGPVRKADSPGSLFGILFNSFIFLLVGIAVFTFLSLPRSPVGSIRTLLGLESAIAVVTFVGLIQRRKWGRMLAIFFILGNAVLGMLGLVQRGQGDSLAWGPGPLAMLLFLLPFLSRQARDRFSR